MPQRSRRINGDPDLCPPHIPHNRPIRRERGKRCIGMLSFPSFLCIVAVCQLDAELQVVCAQCSSRQPTSNLCTTCGIEFGTETLRLLLTRFFRFESYAGKYFCSICNFWDDRLERNYYHCDGCGMCRVGGREKYASCCAPSPAALPTHRCANAISPSDLFIATIVGIVSAAYR